MSDFKIILLSRSNLASYLFLFFVSSVTAHSNLSPYVDDFNNLIKELNLGYANLLYARKIRY